MSREEGESDHITIFNLSIPCDREMKATIRNMVMRHVRELIEDDEQIRNALLNGIVKHKSFFKTFFKPVIREAMEDMNFTVEVKTMEAQE